ncbi:RNA polymerase [Longquan Berylmys bowersi morbillivirus 1]|uniref:RNA-directed RNA polymerase L n=1 Tax=Longquan Berylmys bowersi morbillivirus 1 TaxID=2877504 RepID=A0AAE9BV84_9MONO|nr:RNA polymerase [Longquan Berylmys bowersi morbillivirus 1]
MSDLDDVTSSVASIIYPEVHLDSPIVTSKLVYHLEYAELPHNQHLYDQTLIKNITYNKINNGRNHLTAGLVHYGEQVKKALIPFKNALHIPYPHCNQRLFNYHDINLSYRLLHIHKYAKRGYNKISPQLIRCLQELDQSLGSTQTITTQVIDKMRDLPLIYESSQWFEPFLFWFTVKTELRKLIKQSGTMQSKYIRVYPHAESQRTIVLFHPNLVTIINKESQSIYYLTVEHVLMYCDVIEGRLQTESLMRLDCKYSILHSRVSLLWELIDGLFEDLGNTTYDIVALLEPLALAHLQLLDECTSIRGCFLKQCLSDLDQLLLKNGYRNESDITNLHLMIYNIFEPSDIHLTAEIFSFFRSFGHPTLEAITAAEKVRAHMSKPKVIDYQILMKGHAIFCGIIINGHRDRHGGSWPPCTLPSHADEKIIHLKNNGEALTDALCIEHWTSFVGFHFKCFMPLELDSDLTMYLKDKALAALKKEWDSVYQRDVLRYKPPRGTTSRRLVSVFLEDSQFDPYNMINYVLSGDYMRDPDFNLSYSLKEKEIKLVGRLFAKMTYKMRACQVIAENLIANGVGKFFKDNGMVKDEHDLTKALHTLAISSIPKDGKFNHKNYTNSNTRVQLEDNPSISTISYKGHSKSKLSQRQIDEQLTGVNYETVSAFITADLQKYCLNWRYETTSVFAERLNEIYGLPNFFQWLHNILEKSVLYVSDPYCPPDLDDHCRLDDVPNDHIYIKYPMGGIEGFCQKMWTISTIPFLYLAGYNVGVRISSLVQGDNQAIAVTKRVPSSWPYRMKKEEAMVATKLYFKELRRILGWIGHNLKEHETLLSSHFFIYSKGIYYDGMLLSQSLKSISRCVFWSETIVDETRSACSNIATTIAKAIERGCDRYIAYCYCIYKTLLQVIVALRFTINPTMTEDVINPLMSQTSQLLQICLIPAPIGGFNYLNMSRLFVRNIGDVVTASFADIKRMIMANLLPSNILDKIMTQDAGDSKFLDWASDPYSANLPAVQSITKLIKNITARYVLTRSPNPMLQDLFHEGSQEEDNELAIYLMDRDIIIPRAAHEILDNSLTGARESIAGMLDTTKGLIRTGLKRGGLRPHIVQKLSLYDYRQFQNAIRLLENQKADDLIDVSVCSVSLAQALRKHMWSALARGRPIYGLEVPDVLECLKGVIIKGHSNCIMCEQGSDHYGWFFIPAQCQLDQITNETNSLRVPYIGSTTDERSDMKLSYVRSPSRPLKAAVRLATVYTWAFGDDDETWQQAWSLARQRANVSLNDLKLITPISTSTNLAHRLRDRSTQVKYSGTSLVRVSRYVSISNDHLSFTIEGKRVDTNFIYQQCMLLGLAILEQKFRCKATTGLGNLILHLHADTNCCIIRMEDQPFIRACRPLPVIRVCANNRLIYDSNPVIERDQIKLGFQDHLKPLLDFVTWDTNQLYHALSKSTASTLIEIITKTEKDHLNEIKAITADDDINSMITEMLLVRPKLFSIYLGQAIAINWAYEINYRRPKGKYEMCELLYGLLTRSSKNSFRVICNALSHDKVYRRLWNAGLVEPIHGPSLDTQNMIHTVIDMMVLCYQTYLDMLLDDEIDDYPYLICESDLGILNERVDNAQAKHLCIIADLYCDPSHIPVIRGLTPIQKCRILTDHINLQSSQAISGIFWNTKPIKIEHYPCSLTYIRRGTIKQIRLRVDPGVAEDIVSDLLNPQIDNKKLPDINWSNPVAQTYDSDLDDIISGLRTIDKVVPLSGEMITNYEIHAYRRVGVNSSACYKAFEILSFITGYIDHTKARMYIGEGAGSMMVIYQHYLGHGKVYYNSGVYIENLQGQREFRPFPAEVSLAIRNSRGLWNSSIQVLFNGRPEVTWIGNLECYHYITSQIQPGSLGFIHSDIESTSEKTTTEIFEELVHVGCLSLLLGEPKSSLVMKIMPRPGDYTYLFLRFMREHYETSMLIYPGFSNPSSSECYILFRGLRMNRLLNPVQVVNRLVQLGPICSQQLYTMILDIKSQHSIITACGPPYIKGYKNSYLSKVTDIEKYLMKAGLELNGPKCLKKLGNFDLTNIQSTTSPIIKSLFKELAVMIDPTRNIQSIFQHYPVLMKSRVREQMTQIAKKVFIYFVFSIDDEAINRDLVSNLKKGVIILDIDNRYIQDLIPNFIKKVILSNLGQKVWIVHLTTAEIKECFKILGYSMIYNL